VFSGLKVIEMGSGAAGPVATRYLAEQGATVIKIESSKRPDFLRVLWLTPDSQHGLEGSPMFVMLNPGKHSIAIDMKDPRGVALAKRLVEWADVLCENFAPGPMERFGMTWHELREINPRLVMASGCLFGQTGPHRTYPGFGAQGSALSGFNHLTGWPDRASTGPSGTITDSLAPRYVALAIVGALIERDRTGHGQFIDLSQVETAVYSTSDVMLRWFANGEIVTRNGNRNDHAAPHGAFPCAGDDRWIAIACRSDAEWRSLRSAMGSPDWAAAPELDTLAGRKANEDELERRIAEWTAGFEPHALMERLQVAGVPAGAVQTFDDLVHDPQLAARGHYQQRSHPALGPLLLEHAGFRLSDSPPDYAAAGPTLGAHTSWVLRDVLGLPEDEIASLEADGVLV
jgi:crotonobetainyl-CoA:carnitine CoA-transferase CaiB-like acyl-CoA transferase